MLQFPLSRKPGEPEFDDVLSVVQDLGPISRVRRDFSPNGDISEREERFDRYEVELEIDADSPSDLGEIESDFGDNALSPVIKRIVVKPCWSPD